ncbi:MAG TPA: caspase family protein [Thermoanaerobaculia bacterium]|nr:caspase family protein [Thermoanaerobaculia bacterium]
MFVAVAAIALFTTQPQAHLVAQLGHSAPVHAIAYSPDGRLVVTASNDATARLWDAATGHELRTLAGHTEGIDAVAVSPDGRFVATGSRDKTAKLWDSATGAEVRTLPHGNGAIVAVAFSPDGQFVLTGGWDAAVTFWDVATGEPVRTLSGLDKGVSSVAVSPDGRKVVTGSSDHTARLWDAANGAALRTLPGHTNTVSAVAFSPDSRSIATASWDHTVRVWNTENGSVVHTLKRHEREVTSVAFSPDGRRLLSGSRDGTAVLWDAESGKALGAATGHMDWISSVAFSPDGRYLLTGSHDKTTRQWDSRGEVKPLTFASRSSGLWAAAYSPDGRLFATGGRDGVTTLWDTSTGQPARLLTGHEDWVSSIAFAPDGESIATASWDTTVKLWSVNTGALLRTFAGHSSAVTSVVFSPDGASLATRVRDKSAKVWSVATGTEVHAFAAGERPVDSIAFSPDSKYLMIGWNAAAQIWDTATWKPGKVIGPHTFDFELPAVVFSPDARVVLTASGDGTARLWNARSGAALRNWNAHGSEIRSAVFSPDGRFILTGSSDRTARLWNASTGAEIRTFSGHTGSVNAAVFSRDGKFVLTASDDGTARLWEIDSGSALSTLIAFADEEWAVVDRDGRFDASRGGDVEGLHWVTGDEVIALHRLKSRYYDPYLLAKLLGTKKEDLIDVTALDRIPPSPGVEVAGPVKGSTKITITVRNRGGGIGNVRVLVNRKEFADDACGTRRGTWRERIECVVDLASAHLLPGDDNTIDVVAWNNDETISRGVAVVTRTAGDGEKRRPELYAILVGISEYASPSLRLRYAAKDANDMASAIELGGRGLFGAERVHLTRLVTGDPLVKPPTKANLKAAFAAAERAQPGDVLLVYFAGHGTAIVDDYVYPTSQATTVDLDDTASRERDAVTGTELVDWIKKIRALKQVMILDTCAAGAVAAHFQPGKRSESSSIVRALEQLSSRTGFHVLMGSAADAVSYESDGLGQGLLTYALLHGMKGAALDGEIVDVSKLFQHAADHVPLLARQKTRVQRPQIAAPRGLTFPIGRLGVKDRDDIKLPLMRPIVLRPLLLNADANRDDLQLTAALKNALLDHSYAKHEIDFVDKDDYPGGIRPEGTYKVAGSRAVVSLVLSQDQKPIASFDVEGFSTDVPSLTEKMKAAVCAAILNGSREN